MINQYSVLRKLGSGSFSVVKLVHNNETGIDYVIFRYIILIGSKKIFQNEIAVNEGVC